MLQNNDNTKAVIRKLNDVNIDNSIEHTDTRIQTR
jgi:hypothetical protein